MKLIRPVVALAAVGSVAALTVPSQAAAPAYKSKKLALSDAKGDANGINNQGFTQAGSPNAPVAGYDGYDIVKLDLASTGRVVKQGRKLVPVCTGFTVKLTFAGAVGPQSIIRVTGVGTNNDARWWLQQRGTTTTVRYGHSDSSTLGSTDETIPLTTPAKVSGSTITFTVLAADLKATGEKLEKFRYSDLGVSLRSDLVQATAPQWDELPASGKELKPC